MTGAQALVEAIAANEAQSTPDVHSLQDLHTIANYQVPIAN
jgi:hypothetical protein